MTLVFILFCLLCTALTANVVRPVYHHPKMIVPSFIFGWLVGELALHVVFVEVVIVFLFVCFGVVSGFWAGIALMICISSWMILTYHYYSGYKAKVLMEGIVSPHRNKEDLKTWGRHSELDSTRLLRPFSSWQDENVEVLRDIIYHEVDGFRLKLDIRRSKGQISDNTSQPVLFQIHGGAWTHGYGSKNEQGIPLMVELAKRGWVSVSIDYRLCPHASFPDHIIDCKRALVWVKENISEYGGDPEFIVATGGSAGGHLSALLAISANCPEFQPGFEEKNTRVQGCVPFYGIYDLMDEQRLQLSVALDTLLHESVIKQSKNENPALYELMSPISHIHKDAPPFLLVHGDKDSLTCLAEAQYFASRLDETSEQTVEFAEVAGAQHAFDVFSSLRSDYVLMGVTERLTQWHRDFQEK